MAGFHLADLWEGVARVRGDATALICGEEILSFNDLDQRATRFARGLNSQGIDVGDHVGLYMGNCVEFVVSLLACFKLSAVPVNINYRYVENELQYLFDNADLKAVIYAGQFRSLVMSVQLQSPLLKVLVEVQDPCREHAPGVLSYDAVIAMGNDDTDFGERDEMALYLLYTGGTTGLPKGVMWPHRHLFFRALGGGAAMGGEPVECPEELFERAAGGLVTLLGSPLMHGASQWSCLVMLLAGNTIALSDRASFDADHMWDLVEQHRVNNMSIVGDAMAFPLIESLEKSVASGRRMDLSSLFLIGSGGALLSDAAQEKLQQLLPDLIIFNGFGSSESGVHGRGVQAEEGGLIEIPVTPMTALLDEENNRISPDSRETGIIAFTGNTPIGYYKDEEKSAKTFISIDGETWILTGDRGAYTPRGTISMMGRDSVCINTGGEKVFAEEVESVVKTYPGIRDCLVVGVPDEKFGQRVAAVVELDPVGMAPGIEELREFCSASLSRYKLPRNVVVEPMIRREPNGKPNYRWATQAAQAALAKA